jgi:hypothetical protein
MNSDKATRRIKSSPAGNCTEYHLHKSQTSERSNKNILDFSAFKIMQLMSKTPDESQRLMLAALLRDYREGHVAIGWKEGLPVWIRVTAERGKKS